MAAKKQPAKTVKKQEPQRKQRNFPSRTLEASLPVPQKIQDESAGRPFRRLLLAEALGIKPASTNFEALLSASYKYGLTEGPVRAVAPSSALFAAGSTFTGLGMAATT